MPSILPPDHNPKKLLCYQKAKLVYALNNWFLENTDLRFKRTQEQMEHAARSGKQNIVEGLNNYATSKASGIHVVNVAKGSLKELQEDYEDFLLRHGMKQWQYTDRLFKRAQQLGKENNSDPAFFIEKFETLEQEMIANIIIVLIGQAVFLIGQLLKTLEADLLQNGGFRENIYKYRKSHQQKPTNPNKPSTSPSKPTDPSDSNPSEPC